MFTFTAGDVREFLEDYYAVVESLITWGLITRKSYDYLTM